MSLIHHRPSMIAGTGTEIHQRRGARSYYTDVGKYPIGGGLELWQGLFQYDFDSCNSNSEHRRLFL